MKRQIFVLPIIILSVVCILLATGCSSAATGTLEFRANGEDFVREGFISVDGWDIGFDHVYICLDNVTAYQTNPPYDPQEDGELDTDTIEVQVDLGGPYIKDLAAGDENADPILVGQVADAEIGSYNAISWSMVKAASGDAEGYSLVFIGTAEKGDDTIDFTISIEFEYSYSGGEYVGEDEIKGVLSKNGTADLEMTFHFDHIFGDASVELDDHINIGAVGFDPFAALAVDDVVDVDMAELKSNINFSTEDYLQMLESLPTLGHVGEGHGHCEQWW